MPIYEFKCKECNKKQEVLATFSDYNVREFGNCKKCGKVLLLTDQSINFTGAINMNSSSVGVAKRRYSNAAGGPKPIIDNKVRHDLNMPRG